VLDVSFNRLTQFPEDWTLLYQLAQLNLAGNDLQRLPKDIKKLRNLVSLDLSDNLIDQLPDQLAKLRSLQHLSIGDNIVMQWPTNFVKLQQKVEVRCRRCNPLRSFAHSFVHWFIHTLVGQSLRGLAAADLHSIVQSLRELPSLSSEVCSVVRPGAVVQLCVILFSYSLLTD